MRILVSLSASWEDFERLGATQQASYLRKHKRSPFNARLLNAQTVTPRQTDVFRVEHVSSGKGPYQHGTQEGLIQAFNANKSSMEDIDEIPLVQAILNLHPRAIFGFNTLKGCERFVKSRALMKDLGFEIKVYKNVMPLYVSLDGQVIFEKSR